MARSGGNRAAVPSPVVVRLRRNHPAAIGDVVDVMAPCRVFECAFRAMPSLPFVPQGSDMKGLASHAFGLARHWHLLLVALRVQRGLRHLRTGHFSSVTAQRSQIMFKKLVLSAGFIVAGGFLFGSVAHAQHGHHRHGGWNDHGRFHDHLRHKEFHRHLEHREAHRYPMSRWQHGRLHDHLDHDRYHDDLRHRQYHRSYRAPSYHYRSYRSYGRGGVGIGISPYGFSLRIGR